MRDIVYVGGGVATIFSLIELLKSGVSGKRILVIEEGADFYKRSPKEYIKGFGGAGFFSDGKIIFSTVQGGELVKYTGEEKALDLMKKLEDHVRFFHPDEDRIQKGGISIEPDFLKSSQLKLRQSNCIHIGTDYLKIWNEVVYKFFKKKKVKFLFNTCITNIDMNNKVVYTERNKRITYNKLVVAVGKSGTSLITDLIHNYNLRTSPKAAQIGVRFESKCSYFEKLAKEFYDFKLCRQYGDDIFVRTFCCNHIAAYVAVEKMHDMNSYNGHAYKDESKINGMTNFGIMLEIQNIADPLKFTKNLVEKSNVGNIGKYVSPDGGLKPTVEAKQISPQHFIKIYDSYAYIILDFINKLNDIFKFDRDYLFYLPEVKYLTNEIDVNHKNLSLKKYKDVHLIGDCLSSRGICIAGCQGIYVAENLKGNDV